MTMTPSPEKTERAGHTEGPWSVDKPLSRTHHHYDSGTRCIVSDTTRQGVANTTHGWEDPTVAEANARLIAAAPDLLDAAQQALDCAQSLTPEMSAAYKALRAAIQKATQTP